MDKTLKILNICRRLDVISSSMYKSFSSRSSAPARKSFWDGLADEEAEHILFWEEMKEKYSEGIIPDIINDKERVLKTLSKIVRNARALEREAAHADEKSFFLHAYRMEMHLMDDVFLNFFNFASTISSQLTCYIDYENHLDTFFSGMNRLSDGSFETKLVVETVKNLWKRNNELVQQNMLDYLTGVYNRNAFFSILSPYAYLAVRNKTPVAVMMIDIDDFKRTNDTLGHPAGDVVLKETAAVIRKRIRKSDIIARYGGDEFIVFLYGIDQAAAQSLAESIHDEHKKAMLRLSSSTVSIGVSWSIMTGKPDEEILSMIRSADNSLYRVKRRGKSGVHVSKRRG